MLNETQQSWIRATGQHSLHDHWFASLIYGEAFLDDGMLAYFDGRVLTLCAFPIGVSESVSPVIIRDWALRWVQRTDAESMMLMAPHCPDMRSLRSLGFQRRHTWPACPITREMIAVCSDEGRAPGLRRRIRRAKAQPYHLVLNTGGAIDADKLVLVEKFFKFTGMTPYLAALTMVWPAIMSHQRVHFIEAWRDESLAGVVALHRAFETGCVALAMARDPNADGVTDFLYAHMIAPTRSMACSWINLCSSSSWGQHAFKLKWAQPSPLPAYALTEWRRPGMARRYHCLWGPRTIRLSPPCK